MTPDLDQTLSLKAQLVDQVSPALEKIDKSSQTTQEALKKMAESGEQAGETLGRSTTNMADKTDHATGKMKDSLGQAGSAFKEFGTSASEGSKQAGKALEEALYSGNTASRLQSLEKDLKDLDSTFGSMAGVQRAATGRARSLSHISHDSINKKLIPAFQELHGTLDQYPDTLSKINKMEQDRMNMLEGGEGGNILSKVGSRIAGVSDRIAEAQGALGEMWDMVKGVTAPIAGLLGLAAFSKAGGQAQEVQRTMLQVGGIDEAQQVPVQLAQTMHQAQIPLDEAAEQMLLITQYAADAADEMPSIVTQMTNISKATGVASSEVIGLRDKIVSLADVDGEGFQRLFARVSSYATETRADISEMTELFAQAGDEMIRFSGDARDAYANAVLAAGATARQFGMEAGAPGDLYEGARTNMEQAARLQGLIADTGKNVYDLVRQGAKGELFADAISEAMKKLGGEQRFLDPNRNPQLVGPEYHAFQEIVGQAGVTEDMFMRAIEAVRQHRAEGGTEDFYQIFMREAERIQKGTEAIDDKAAIFRKTLAEQSERYLSEMNSGLIIPGAAAFEMLGTFSVEGLSLLHKGMNKILGVEESVYGEGAKEIAGWMDTAAAGTQDPVLSWMFGKLGQGSRKVGEWFGNPPENVEVGRPVAGLPTTSFGDKTLSEATMTDVIADLGDTPEARLHALNKAARQRNVEYYTPEMMPGDRLDEMRNLHPDIDYRKIEGSGQLNRALVEEFEPAFIKAKAALGVQGEPTVKDIQAGTTTKSAGMFPNPQDFAPESGGKIVSMEVAPTPMDAEQDKMLTWTPEELKKRTEEITNPQQAKLSKEELTAFEKKQLELMERAVVAQETTAANTKPQAESSNRLVVPKLQRFGDDIGDEFARQDGRRG
jgi:hypothetical protein